MADSRNIPVEKSSRDLTAFPTRGNDGLAETLGGDKAHYATPGDLLAFIAAKATEVWNGGPDPRNIDRTLLRV